MKLLLVVNSIHPGGAENFAFYLIKYLRENYGYNIHIAYVRNVESSAGEYNYKELSVNFPLLWLGKKPNSGVRGLYTSYATLKKIIRNDQYDFILSTCELPDLFNAIIPSAAVKVTTLQNAIPWAHLPFLGRLLERFFVNPRLQSFVAVSKSVKDIWISKYGVRRDSVTIIPNGVHDIFFTGNEPRQLPGGTFKLGVVARLEPQKGHIYLLQAMKELKGKLNVHLGIVGKGSQEEKLKQYVAAEGLEEMVTFYGWYNREEVFEFYKSLDALVMSSLFEGLPLNGIEAMAMGLPVIGSRSPGIVDFLNDENGLLFEPMDYKALADCIIRLAGDGDLYRHLSLRSRQSATQYHFSTISEQYHKLLTGLKQ